MLNPRLAERYAKSLMDIAKEQGKLEAIYSDMLSLNQMCKDSKDFLLLMRSPVVKADSKNAIMKALLEGKIDGITHAFTRLIINKGREYFLPEIAAAFIAQYKKHSHITEVTITTSEALDEGMMKILTDQVQKQLQGQTIDLSSKVDPNIIGGFILEANNNLFDASILRDLNDIRKQFLKNEYVPDIR